MTFSWQAPNSNAVLFLGSKWIELHRFTSKLIAARSTLQPVPRLLSESLVSKRYPAWLDHALKLSRARGYWTLYPSQMTARKLATVHTDLWHPPEEHDAAGLMSDAPDSSEVVLAAGALPGSLPAFNDMPFLLWDGTPANPVQADEAKQKYANEFRSAVGGCENFLPRELAPHSSMRDLFCQRIPTNDDDE